MGEVGRVFILLGVVLVLMGLLLTFVPRIGWPRLPGDIVVQRDGFTFYFPIVTSIVVSVVLTLLLNALWWARR